MKTLVKSLAVVVAMASFASAEEKAAQPESAIAAAAASEQAYAQLKGNRAGEEREFEIASGIKMKFVWCPPGEFMMGSPKFEEGRENREDQAKVTLSKGFWIAKTEVTQSQWVSVMGSNPFAGLSEKNKDPNFPVVGVSWDDAQKFMDKINANLGNADGGKMALPTEAQFEYAARAGEVGKFPGGSPDVVAWHDGTAAVI
jgi:formylglycine-generating enzyme required for sulfatase activity